MPDAVMLSDSFILSIIFPINVIVTPISIFFSIIVVIITIPIIIIPISIIFTIIPIIFPITIPIIIIMANFTEPKTLDNGEIREAFRVLDRDGNGFISKQELGMAMRSLGYMPSEVELAIIMQRLDMDGLVRPCFIFRGISEKLEQSPRCRVESLPWILILISEMRAEKVIVGSAPFHLLLSALWFPQHLLGPLRASCIIHWGIRAWYLQDQRDIFDCLLCVNGFTSHTTVAVWIESS
ncbi:Calcium-binding protein 8 [Camelus dromedarius]|uniref:Calcium-binding protein 8 n=1 Tax=Camelus dromedarius TaxID=9838 RepID=A0A5N4CWR3_CAMDR|nr:Calcium-binding protein 8 [Camelus dromedarius]